MNTLQHLASYSHIVADSSKLDDIEQFSGLFGVTTNPTLVMQALDASNDFDNLIYEATQGADASADEQAFKANACDTLLALIGSEFHRLFGVQVSLEVDARLAHDSKATFNRAQHIAGLCASFSMPANKLLIKIAATEAGIAAVKQLKKAGIHCNVTLVFCLEQAVAAADAGAWLVSPFVGRVSDWYQKHQPGAHKQCPGVDLVRTIQGYMRHHGYATKVMGASFRNTTQILDLCGTDLLTIAPGLLKKLENMQDLPQPYPGNETCQRIAAPRSTLSKKIEKNPMAAHLLKDGIDRFIGDQLRLEKLMLQEIRA